MRKKWVLKKSLTELRAAKSLSMEALAEQAFTTNTTIFRIEKTGTTSDLNLAEKLASIFGVPFAEFWSYSSSFDEMEKSWKTQIECPYQTKSDPQKWYYLVFVRRYDRRGEYSVISPTRWVDMDGGMEHRKLTHFAPDGVIEHLNEYGVRCAVVHDFLALIYFYYGIPANSERAALVCTDVAESVYPGLVKDYLCKTSSLPNHYDFKDLVQVELHGGAPPTDEEGG